MLELISLDAPGISNTPLFGAAQDADLLEILGWLSEKRGKMRKQHNNQTAIIIASKRCETRIFEVQVQTGFNLTVIGETTQNTARGFAHGWEVVFYG